MNPHVNKKSKKAEIKPPIPSKEVQPKGKNVYSFQKEVIDREPPNQSLNHSILMPPEPPQKKWGFQIFTGKDQQSQVDSSKELSVVMMPSRQDRQRAARSVEPTRGTKDVDSAHKVLKNPPQDDSLFLKGEPYAENFLRDPPGNLAEEII